MQVKKQQLEEDMEQQTGSKLGKEYVICILSPLYNLYTEYILWNTRLDEAQAGIKIAGRNINNFRYADDITLMAGVTELPKESVNLIDERDLAFFSLHPST